MSWVGAGSSGGVSGLAHHFPVCVLGSQPQISGRPLLSTGLVCRSADPSVWLHREPSDGSSPSSVPADAPAHPHPVPFCHTEVDPLQLLSLPPVPARGWGPRSAALWRQKQPQASKVPLRRSGRSPSWLWSTALVHTDVKSTVESDGRETGAGETGWRRAKQACPVGCSPSKMGWAGLNGP